MKRVMMAGMAAVLLATFAVPASAAVLCQKKKRVKVRAEECKGKEVQIQDLGAHAALWQTECTGEPERDLVVGSPPFLFDGEQCYGGCRQFDGDELNCDGAYQLTWSGPSACVFIENRCVPCKDCGERAGACIDACEPKQCAVPSRTDFFGGPNTRACRNATTEAACNVGWAMQYGRTPVSCYWDGIECRGCGSNNESQGNCSNVCRPTDACANPGLTFVDYCNHDSPDEATCATRFTDGGGGFRRYYSCYWDALSRNCEECRGEDDFGGRCDDTCNDWPGS